MVSCYRSIAFSLALLVVLVCVSCDQDLVPTEQNKQDRQTYPERYITITKVSYTPNTNWKLKGNVDSIAIKDRTLVISGWSAFSGVLESQTLNITSNFKGTVLQAIAIRRPDLVREEGKDYEMAGFEIHIELLEQVTVEDIHFCMTSSDPRFGSYRLHTTYCDSSKV